MLRHGVVFIYVDESGNVVTVQHLQLFSIDSKTRI